MQGITTSKYLVQNTKVCAISQTHFFIIEDVAQKECGGENKRKIKGK